MHSLHFQYQQHSRCHTTVPDNMMMHRSTRPKFAYIGHNAARDVSRKMSLDDMAEREMAKQQRKQQGGESSGRSFYSASQKEFDDLVRAIPDPASEEDSLLADGALSDFWFSSVILGELLRDSQVTWPAMPMLPLQLWNSKKSEGCGDACMCRSGAVWISVLCHPLVHPCVTLYNGGISFSFNDVSLAHGWVQSNLTNFIYNNGIVYYAESFLGWESSLSDDPTQSWDGVDGAVSLLDAGSLSSLPFGDMEAEEAAAAASEGVPTYRGSRDGRGDNMQSGSRGVPPMLPTSRAFKKPGTQTPEEDALEEFLMSKAVDEGMTLHHARLEAAHNRYSVAAAFGELLEDIEQDDVWRNAEPLLPGTEMRIPTWIRASEAIVPLMDELNAATMEYEIQQSEVSLQEAEEHILEEVESARKLLSLTDPKAGLSVDPDAADLDALDEFFGDAETLLPGASDILHGEEGEIRRLAQGQENSVMNSLLEEILPEISGYALDYADLTGDGTGSPGMLSGALQALTDEVDTVLEEEDIEEDIEEEEEEEVEE
jgi:hypothetical protein